MIVDIAGVSSEGSRFEGEESPEILELAAEGDVRLAGPIHYDVTVLLAGGELLVRGQASVPASFACCRCTEFSPVRVVAVPIECERELPEDAEFVDLTGDIRESILLNFPAYPVCRPECAGLCPQCGANLNHQRCACRRPASGGWEALDGLKKSTE